MRLIFFSRIFKGLLTWAAAFVTLSLVAAAVLSGRDDPKSGVSIISALISCISAFAGGVISTKGLNAKLAQGIAFAFTVTGVLVCLSAFFGELTAQTALKLTVYFISALSGAMIGKNQTNSRRSVKRRRTVLKRYAH